jgi:hypothetical protein
MTLLIPLLLRLTTLFERGVRAEAYPADPQVDAEEMPVIGREKE